MNDADGIAVAELADELGVYRATIFKNAKRLGIQPTKRRDPMRKGQQISVVTVGEAENIREAIGASRRAQNQDADQRIALTGEDGWFYLMQLEPEYDPGRFKLGFTTDRDGRLRQHRCSAPFAQYARCWPSRRTWERAAIDCMTAGLERIHTEVFRGASLDSVIERGDSFFKVMPMVSIAPEVDEEEPEAIQ